MTVETGDVQGAGTDANVFLVLYGDERKSDQVSLKDCGKFNFRRAQVDTFKVSLAAFVSADLIFNLTPRVSTLMNLDSIPKNRVASLNNGDSLTVFFLD